MSEIERSEDYNIFHQHYIELKKMIEPNYLAVHNIVFEINDDDERRFFTVLTEFFLQKMQREGLAKDGIVI